jgi:twitching motility protein PilT
MDSSDENRARRVWSKLLDGAFTLSASDVHLRCEATPHYRIQGELRSVDHPPLSENQVEGLCEVLSGQSAVELRLRKRLDFACAWNGKGRLRGQYYQSRGRPALALRVIPSTVPSMQELRLPPPLRKICTAKSGLILVTGSTGMGKSTTLAAMLQAISQSSNRHIVTIEDPVEYLIEDSAGYVTQCEIGTDMPSFQEGLTSVLRLDPDVLMIGEIRDRTTMEVAMRAAISGHLVLAAVHFADASRTIAGVVGMSPPEEHNNWRLRLADALIAIISQRLLPLRGATGRVLASELLVSEPSVKAIVQDETKMRGLRTAISRGRTSYGSHTMDQSLLELLQAQLISLEVAKAAAVSPAELVREVNLKRIAV